MRFVWCGSSVQLGLQVRTLVDRHTVKAHWQDIYHYTAPSLGSYNQMRRSTMTGDEQAVLVSRRRCMPLCHGKECDAHVRSCCCVQRSTLQQRLFDGAVVVVVTRLRMVNE